MRGTGFSLMLAVALLAGHARATDGVHVVQPGETLWKIAGLLTGDPSRWPEIYRANRDQIKDPGTLYPGQELSIPDLGAVPARSLEVGEALPENPEP